LIPKFALAERKYGRSGKKRIWSKLLPAFFLAEAENS